MSNQLGIQVVTEFQSVQQMTQTLQGLLDQVGNNVRINIQSNLHMNHSSIQQTQQQAENVQHRIQKIFAKPIQINTSLNGMAHNEIQSRLQTIRNEVDSLAKVSIDATKTGKVRSAIIEYRDEAGKVTKEFMQWSNHLDRANNVMKRVFGTTRFQFVDDIVKSEKTLQSSLSTLNNYEKTVRNIKNNYSLVGSGVKDTNHLSTLNGIYASLRNNITDYKNTNAILTAEQKRNIENEITRLTILITRYKDLERASEKSLSVKESTLDSLYRYEKALNRIKTNYSLNSGVKEEQSLSDLDNRYDNIINTINRYRNANTQLTAEQKRELDEQITQLGTLTTKYKDMEKTAEKGFNFKQYTDISEEVIRINNAQQLHNESLLQGHKLISANVQETKEYYKVTQSLQRGNDMVGLTAYIDKATGKTYEFNRSIKDNMHDTITWEKALKTAIVRQTQWLTSGSLLFSGISFVKQGISDVIALDTALIDLKKVTNATDSEYKQFITDVNELAISVGHSTTAAIDATTSFAKLGYSISESSKLAKSALVYSNTGDISIDDATQNIISTMKAYSMSVQDVTRVIDVANEVGNNWAITSGGIGEALQRSASALNEANNSYEQSVSLITAANSSIQDTAKVGTAMKSISMSLRSISEESGETNPKLRETIKLISGVDIMKDENTFKSTFDIVKELSTVYDTLSDKQQSLLQNLIAGKYQGNIFASLMENAKDLDSIYETTMSSANSAEIEQSRYMTSINARINEFRESSVRLWKDSINTDTIKSFVDTGTGLINVFDTLINKIGFIPTIVGGTTLAFGLFNKGFKDFSSSFTKSIPVIGDFDSKLLNLNDNLRKQRDGLLKGRDILLTKIQNTEKAGLSTERYSNSLSQVRSQLFTTSLAMKGTALASAALETAMSMGLSLAITGIVSGISHLINRTKEMREANLELVTSVQGNIDNNTQNIKRMQELGNEYNNLKDKVILTAEEKKKFSDVSNEIAKISPKNVLYYDDEGRAILDLKNGTTDLIEELKRKNEIENARLVQGGEDYYKVMTSDVQKAQQEIATLNNQIKNNNLGIGKSETFVDFKNGVDGSKKGLQELYQELENVSDKTSPKAVQLQTEISKLESENNKLSASIELQKDKIDSAKNSIQPYIKALLSTNSTFKNMNDGMKKVVSEMINNLDFSKFSSWAEAEKTINDIFKALGGNTDAQKSIQRLQEIKQELSKNKVQASDVKDEVNKLIVELAKVLNIPPDALSKIFNIDVNNVNKAITEVKTLAEFQKDLVKSISDSKSEVASINDILDEYAEKNTINKDKIMELAQKYPQLLSMYGKDKEISQELTNIKNQQIQAIELQAKKEVDIMQKAFEAKAKIYFAELSIQEVLAKTKAQFLNETLRRAGGTIGLEKVEKDLADMYALAESIQKAKDEINNIPTIVQDFGGNNTTGTTPKTYETPATYESNLIRNAHLSVLEDIQDEFKVMDNQLDNIQGHIKLDKSLNDNNKLLSDTNDLLDKQKEKVDLITTSQKKLADEKNTIKDEFYQKYNLDISRVSSPSDFANLEEKLFPSQTFANKDAKEAFDKNKATFDALRDAFLKIDDALIKFDKDLINVQDEIFGTTSEIENLQLSITTNNLDKSLKPLDASLKDLDRNLKSIDDNDFISKTSNMTSKIEIHNQKIQELNKSLEELSSKSFNTASGQEELSKAIEETKNKIEAEKDSVLELNKALNDQARTMVRDLIEKQKELDEQSIETQVSQKKTDIMKSVYGFTKEEFESYRKQVRDNLTKDIEYAQSKINSIGKTDSLVKETDRQYLQDGIKAKQIELDSIDKLTYASVQNQQDMFEKLHQSKIDAIDLEIQKMEEQNDAQAENEERAKRAIELEKLKIQLQETNQERNIQILKKQADGSWQFDYTFDAEKVEDLTDQYNEKVADNAKWETDLNKKHRKEELEQQKKYEQDLINAKKSSYDEQIKTVEIWEDTEKQKIELHYSDIELLVNQEMGKLTTAYGDNWDNVLLVLDTKLDSAKQKIDEFLKLQIQATSQVDMGALKNNPQYQKIVDAYMNTEDPVEKAKLKEQMDNLSGQYKTSTPVTPSTNSYKDTQTYKDLVNQYMNATSQSDKDKIKKQVDDLVKGTVKLNSGAMTPSWSDGDNTNGKLAILHPNEVINNPVDSSLLLKATELAKSINVDSLKNIVNNIPKLNIPSFDFAKNINPSMGKVENHYTIQNLTLPNVISAIDDLVGVFNDLPNYTLQQVRTQA